MNLINHKINVMIAQVLVVQLALICIISLILSLVVGKRIAYSVLCGGLAVWLPNLYGIRVSFKANILRVHQSLVWFYVGLMAKWLLMIIILSAILLKAPALNHVALMVGFVVAVLISGFIPFFLNFNKFIVAR